MLNRAYDATFHTVVPELEFNKFSSKKDRSTLETKSKLISMTSSPSSHQVAVEIIFLVNYYQLFSL